MMERALISKSRISDSRTVCWLQNVRNKNCMVCLREDLPTESASACCVRCGGTSEESTSIWGMRGCVWGLPKEGASTCSVLGENSHRGGLHMLCIGRGTSQGDPSTSCICHPFISCKEYQHILGNGHLFFYRTMSSQLDGDYRLVAQCSGWQGRQAISASRIWFLSLCPGKAMCPNAIQLFICQWPISRSFPPVVYIACSWKPMPPLQEWCGLGAGMKLMGRPSPCCTRSPRDKLLCVIVGALQRPNGMNVLFSTAVGMESLQKYSAKI